MSALVPVNPYTTLTLVKRELKFTESRTDVDGELVNAINRASRYVDDFTSRDYFFHDQSVTPLTYSDRSPEVAGAVLSLPWPIITLTAITLGDLALVEGVDFLRVNPNANQIQGAKLYRLSGAKYRPWNILPTALLTLTGIFGYAQGNPTNAAAVPIGIPARVANATIQIAAAMSGHNRKQIIDLNGQAQDVANNKIPDTAIEMLRQRLVC